MPLCEERFFSNLLFQYSKLTKSLLVWRHLRSLFVVQPLLTLIFRNLTSGHSTLLKLLFGVPLEISECEVLFFKRTTLLCVAVTITSDRNNEMHEHFLVPKSPIYSTIIIRKTYHFSKIHITSSLHHSVKTYWNLFEIIFSLRGDIGYPLSQIWLCKFFLFENASKQECNQESTQFKKFARFEDNNNTGNCWQLHWKLILPSERWKSSSRDLVTPSTLMSGIWVMLFSKRKVSLTA